VLYPRRRDFGTTAVASLGTPAAWGCLVIEVALEEKSEKTKIEVLSCGVAYRLGI